MTLTESGNIAISGSRVKEIENAHGSGVYPKRDIVIVRGEGAWLWDDQGRRYIDCAGGQGSANLGHCNPAVVAAIKAQADKLISCTEVFYNDARAAALEKLVSVTPEGLDRVFFCNSGTEAIEGAIKFARLATGRSEIVACMRGFHGRTMGALSATWESKYREPFQPLVPGFRHVPYNNLEKMNAAITEQTAAVLVEPVQGEGGVRPAEPGYLKQIAQWCRERGALLIVDEVQTGFGRTGTWWGVDHDGVTPDIMALAKSIAGGIPMGAVVFGPRVPEIPKSVHGSTFGGNPLTCAASVAAITYIQEHNLPASAAELGNRFMEQLRQIQSNTIREVRGRGLLIGVELKDKATPVLQELMARGVLALPAGPNVLRFLPPLVIEQAQLDEVVEHVAAVLG